MHLPSSGDWDGFFSTVKQVTNAEVPAPSSCPLQFEFTVEAATYSSNLLEEVGYDLGKFIDQNPGSTISYGSKLCPLDQLEPLLTHHYSYERFKSNYINGIDYPLEPLDNEARRAILANPIERGNYKSALSDEERPHVTKLMQQDVELGYGIPLTVDCVSKIQGAEVYPVGCQNQQTIDEKSNVIPKKRVTHNLSFNRRKGQSVNQRVRKEELPGVMFGHLMRRFLHLIHHTLRNHPTKRILYNKIDVEKAYRRLHNKASIAIKCIAIWFLDKMWEGQYQKSDDQVAILLTRLPFGSTPAPAEFFIASETVLDLENNLLYCQQWDPSTLSSPYTSELPPPERLANDIPFGSAEEADVSLNPIILGGTEGYIDDGACAVLNLPKNWKMVQRAAQAVVMALFLVFRPLAGLFEPVKRPDPASICKLLAKGGLKEIIIFLGWLIDTRHFTIALPIDKWVAWSNSIRDLKVKKFATYGDLSTLIGKLNHVCFIIPDAKYFMNNLRKMESLARRRSKVKLTRGTINDLTLWLDSLKSAKRWYLHQPSGVL